MSEALFEYDVFLSHTGQDKPRVRSLAEKLKAAGLRVWFDEWVIPFGGDITLGIQTGLQQSRVLVLCLSNAAIASEWVELERNTAIFRDPSNRHRRFLTLLLEDCRLPDLLRRLKYLDFRTESSHAFAHLVDACKPPGKRREVRERAMRRKRIVSESHAMDDFTLTSDGATRSLRWADYRQLPLGESLLVSASCVVETCDPYFRFGFKLLPASGQLTSSSTIQCLQPEILLHIGRNDFSRQASGIMSNDLFLTCYMNGERTEPDRRLFTITEQVSVPLRLSVEGNDRLELRIAESTVFATRIRPEIRQRVAVMGWADSANFKVSVSQVEIFSVEDH